MYSSPLGPHNHPRFFGDTVIFSKTEQRSSTKAHILSNLESWLSTSFLSNSKQTFKIRSFPDYVNNKKVYTIEPIDKVPLSKTKKTLFIILKIVATLLIFPRALAEIIRFGLRKSFDLNTKPSLASLKHHSVNKDVVDGPVNIKAAFNMQLDTKELSSSFSLIKNELISKKNIEGISYVFTKSYQTVFEKKSCPGFIFKIPSNFSQKESALVVFKRKLEKDIDNHHIVQKAIQTLKLSHLAIPYKELLVSESTEGPFYVIMEEKLTLPSHENPWEIWKELPELCIPAFIELGCLLSTTTLKYTTSSNFPLSHSSKDVVTMNILGSQHYSYLTTSYTPIFQLQHFCKDLPNMQCVTAVLETLISNDKFLPKTCDKETFCNQIQKFIKNEKLRREPKAIV